MDINSASIPTVSNDQMKCSFPLAIKRFFGTLPGQTMKEFADELRALSADDKQDLIKMLEGVGFIVQAAN